MLASGDIIVVFHFLSSYFIHVGHVFMKQSKTKRKKVSNVFVMSLIDRDGGSGETQDSSVGYGREVPVNSTLH